MMPRRLVSILLAAGAVCAQTPEVPAIVNTYRLPPAGAAAYNTGTVSLSVRDVRELYFESFIVGAQQGEPAAGGSYGASASGAPYPDLARDLPPAERMPRLPLMRNAGLDGVYGTSDDELIVHLRIDKLPTRDACQRVVDQMMRIGLLPGDPDDPFDAATAAVATGRWRVIIHPPRTKGAPPAPSLYYPEAVSATRPDTPVADVDNGVDPPGWSTGAIRDFWGQIASRWRQWDRWVSEVYTNTPNPNVHVDANTNWGQEAEPFFLPYPRYLTYRPLDRTDNNARVALNSTDPGFQPAADAVHGRFFSERHIWENLLLDPDQAADDPTAGTPAQRQPNEIPDSEGEQLAPIQLIINVDSADAPAPFNAAPAGGPQPDGWRLPGVYTSGPAESNGANIHANFAAEADTVAHTVDHAGDPTTGPGSSFRDMSGNPVELTVNLLTGQWWDGAAWRGERSAQRLVPGVGMVELQFEYETAVPGANNALRTDWADSWFGGDDQYNTGDDDWQTAGLPDPRGADGTGGNLDDRSPFGPSYFVAPIEDPRGADGDFGTPDDNRLMRDPFADPTLPEPAATNPPWRVRRFSGWPFHRAFAGVADANADDYQGGPILCRFVVGAMSIVPEDAALASPDPDLLQVAYYDPGAGQYYPQLDTLPAAGGGYARDVYSDLERPVFLLGYRADDGGPGGSRTEDYFFPVRHGGRSATHKVFVRTVLDHLGGGSAHQWTPPGGVAFPTGYKLRGALDPRGDRTVRPNGARRIEATDLLAFHYSQSNANLDGPVPEPPLEQLFHRRALHSAFQAGAYIYDYNGTGTHDRTNVTWTDGNLAAGQAPMYDVNVAFDGDRLPAAANQVYVKDGYSLGLRLDPPTHVDRIEVFWRTGAGAPGGPATPWVVELAVPPGPPPEFMTWAPRPRVVLSPAVNYPSTGVAQNNFAWAPGPGIEDIHGVRIRNTSGATLRVDEIRVVTRGDLRRSVLRAPTAPRQATDPDIAPTPVAGSAVQLTAPSDREFSVVGDNITTAEVRVDVPSYQPPSADAVERQILSDTGTPPGTYATESQPTMRDPAAQNPLWDRYRGEVALYLDETRSRAWSVGNTKSGAPGIVATAGYEKSQWDVNLYRLRYRPSGDIPGNPYSDRQPTYQFVSWYEEDTGWVGAANPTWTAPYAGGIIAARLEPLSIDRQRVGVESYATFDLEFSVGYDRRLSIAESLLDLGKVIHGGIGQWVPATLVNEGNVPLRSVRLYIERPLTPVDLEDGSTVPRLAQAMPVPSWFFQNVAMGAAADDGSIGFVDASGAALMQFLPAAPVGAPTGNAISDLFLRVGRVSVGRQVPLGQPLGNYTGILRAFVDNLGADGNDLPSDGNDLPDNLAEVNLGGAATMKLTVTESPWARINGFWDNEIDRNEDVPGVPASATVPYDPNTGQGTYQPIPHFDPYFTEPNLNEATPVVHVMQDPDEFVTDPPNSADRLWLGASRYEPLGGGANWSVFFRDAARAVLPAGTTLQTGYRSFIWPNSPAARVSNPDETQRNLYPSICRVPDITGPNQQFVLLWHNEREERGSRRSYLQFQRFEDTTPGGLMEIADDIGGQAEVNKQVPRAFVDTVAGTPVMWITWQTGSGQNTQFGFNAVAMPASINAPGTQYVDAVGAGGNQFVNYALRTPPGLTNLMEPAVVPSYRHETSNAAAGGDLQNVNLFYSAWSPLWENQDIYWSRYKPAEDPTSLASVRESPMAEEAFRFNVVATHPWSPNEGFVVLSQPGGRLPFPRQRDELLLTNANHTVYAAQGLDWLMPPEQPRVSYLQGGLRRIDQWNHRGFADDVRPLFDNSRFAILPAAGAPDPALDPLVVLRVYEAPVLTGPPSSDPVNEAPLVGFNLADSVWDAPAGEWVLPLDPNAPGSALLLNRGVTLVRIHPGLGRVTFNRPLYRRGATLPIYVYATYRPCAWRMTSDRSVDSQPTAAFDFWERLVLSWKRTDEGGQSQLWYRTFSLAVPLLRPPVTRLFAVVDDTDADDDRQFNGSQGELSHWYFVARDGGQSNDADGAWSDIALSPTAQGFDLLQHDNSVNDPPTPTAQGDPETGWNAAGMLHFSYEDVKKRVRVWYEYQYTDPAGNLALAQNEEAFYVPGLGPERLVPVDGLGSESQPSLAPEFFYTGYPLGGQANPEPIMATRFWLAWVSTRDLYVEGAAGTDPPQLGLASGNVYYGTFLPDFTPSTNRPW